MTTLPVAKPASAMRKSKVARLPVSQLHQLKSRTLDETIRLEEAGQPRRCEEGIIEEALQLYLDIPLEVMQQLALQAKGKALSLGAYVAQLVTGDAGPSKKRR